MATRALAALHRRHGECCGWTGRRAEASWDRPSRSAASGAGKYQHMSVSLTWRQNGYADAAMRREDSAADRPDDVLFLNGDAQPRLPDAIDSVPCLPCSVQHRWGTMVTE